MVPKIEACNYYKYKVLHGKDEMFCRKELFLFCSNDYLHFFFFFFFVKIVTWVKVVSEELLTMQGPVQQMRNT